VYILFVGSRGCVLATLLAILKHVFLCKIKLEVKDLRMKKKNEIAKFN
jgi:hypothetical protein